MRPPPLARMRVGRLGESTRIGRSTSRRAPFASTHAARTSRVDAERALDPPQGPIRPIVANRQEAADLLPIRS